MVNGDEKQASNTIDVRSGFAKRCDFNSADKCCHSSGKDLLEIEDQCPNMSVPQIEPLGGENVSAKDACMCLDFDTIERHNTK